MNRGLLSVGGIVLAFVVFLAINVVSTRTLNNAQLDLTAGKLYTLSPGTRSVLAKLDEPVTLRLYYSERLGREIPSYATLATRVREMLQSYRTASRGKVRLEIIDPQPFSDEEDRAVGLGLQGVPVNQGGDLVYFGLVGSNSADKDELIPFFQPDREQFLEYDLTKLVYNLSTIKKPAVGLLTTLPMMGGEGPGGRPTPPWAIYTQLAQFFDVRPIDPSADSIPDDIGVLMVVHPKGFQPKTLYAIDQFVLKGGRAMVFVDPHAEGELTRPGMAAQTGLTGSDFQPLFDAWGIEMIPNKVVGDRRAAIQVSAPGTTDTRVRAVNYVAWLNITQGNLNAGDILTAQISTIQMASVGMLKAKEGATTTMTPLIQSSADSEQIDVDKVKMRPDPVGLLAEFKSDNTRYTLATRLAGKVKTAYPNGLPAEAKPDGADAAAAAPATPAAPAAEQIMESRVPLNAIVIADTDLLEDRFWAQVQNFFGQNIIIPQASNGDFVINAVDNLLGSDDLISLRTRGQSARPFTLVDDIQRDAELQYREKERQLTERLKATESKLTELQGGGQGQGDASRTILTREQQEAIDQFRIELVSTRRELRDVQHELRRNIDNLDRVLKFVNIGLMPILIGLAAIVVGVVRMRRRANSRRPAAAMS